MDVRNGRLIADYFTWPAATLYQGRGEAFFRSLGRLVKKA